MARQVYGSAGGSTIVALSLKLIEADCDARYFAEMDQVSPIHSIETILRVKEMASTLEQ